MNKDKTKKKLKRISNGPKNNEDKKQENPLSKFKKNNDEKNIDNNSHNIDSKIQENNKQYYLNKNQNKENLNNRRNNASNGTIEQNPNNQNEDLNNINNKGKYLIQKKYINFLKLERIPSLLFPKKIKNSSNSKIVSVIIINYFVYDINEKNPKKIKGEDIKLINNKILSINTHSIDLVDNKSKIKDNPSDNIKKSKTYINDIYYNKKDGLINFGNTCYFNSFIQILIHAPGLIGQLRDLKDKIHKESMLYSLIQLADLPSRENLYDLRIKFIRSNSSYRYYKQEDSQEFGVELLKNLNNELTYLDSFICLWNLEEHFNLESKNVKNMKNKLEKLNDLLKNEGSDFKFQTIINYFFYYYETALIIYNNKIVNFNYYGDIDNQLSFDKKNYDSKELNIYDMLKSKYLYGNNKLIKLPIIFNITLLRAVIEEPLIKTKVYIDNEIDLREFLDKDFGYYSPSTKYILYALNVCLGSSKRYGHYYSYIIINEVWYKFDDTLVRKVDKKTIEEDLPYIYGIYYINKEYLESFYSVNNDNK